MVWKAVMLYAAVADALVVLHFAYVAFILFGQVLVVIGGVAGWQWVRNWVFRVVHLVSMLIVGVEAACGWVCPLTTWETSLRQAAGQTVAEGSFVGRLAHDLLFVDIPSSSLRYVHIAFALIVLASWWLVPPRFNRRRPAVTSADPGAKPAAGA